MSRDDDSDEVEAPEVQEQRRSRFWGQEWYWWLIEIITLLAALYPLYGDTVTGWFKGNKATAESSAAASGGPGGEKLPPPPVKTNP